MAVSVTVAVVTVMVAVLAMVLQALNTKVTHDEDGLKVSIGVQSHFEPAVVSVAPGSYEHKHSYRFNFIALVK